MPPNPTTLTSDSFPHDSIRHPFQCLTGEVNDRNLLAWEEAVTLARLSGLVSEEMARHTVPVVVLPVCLAYWNAVHMAP